MQRRSRSVYITLGILFGIGVMLGGVALANHETPDLETRVANIEATLGISYEHAGHEEPTGEPPATDVPVAEYTTWHAPGAHLGQDGTMLHPHEHGDAPPDWANAFSMQHFGHPVIFGGDEATPNENLYKHHAFEGFAATIKGVDIFYRFHAQANPMGHMARFHSYEMYARDAAGNVSFWQGWQDFGTDATHPAPFLTMANCGERTSGGPIISGLSVNCDGFQFENWYSRPGQDNFWSWDTGLNLNAPFYHEASDPMDPATWTPTGRDGLTRRIEIAFNGTGPIPRDTWFCSELPDVVVAMAEGNTPDGCPDGTLPQYVASTMPNVEFPSNNASKTFPGAGIVEQPS